MLAWYKELSAKQETWLCVVFSGPYGAMTSLLGTPAALETMATEPEWFLDVAKTYTDFHIGMMELLRAEGVTLDGVFMDEDITFINGPFFSPAMYRDLVMPSAKKLYGYVHDFGGHVYRHTDGDNWKLIPLMIEAGIDFLDPLEVKAGMDLQKAKDAFDRQVVWVGNIDARILYRGDKKEIEDEVRKKLAVFPDGGYLYRTDGPITDEASLEAYTFLIECVKKYGKYKG
jgi:uroporphyrinogen decarboxylase